MSKYGVIRKKQVFVPTGPAIMGGRRRGKQVEQQKIIVVDSLNDIEEGEAYFKVNIK